MADPQGKRSLVIGGETAAGRAIAIGLAEAGAGVAIASLTTGANAEFAINSALNELWAIGRQGLALAIDASDVEQVRATIVRAETELGPLDAIIAITGDATVLRAAFPTRTVIVVAPETDPAAALSEVVAALIR